MTFAIVDKNQLPKPSPRYAQIAAMFRGMGVKIKDEEYERIDSLATSSQFNSCLPFFSKERGWSEASTETDDLLIISALLENNGVSQDSNDDLAAELLIAGHLPRTKPFLLN